MALRDIIWTTEWFEPSAREWVAEGTAYDENDCLISIKFTLPNEDRITVLRGGTVVDYRERKIKDRDIVRYKLNTVTPLTRS